MQYFVGEAAYSALVLNIALYQAKQSLGSTKGFHVYWPKSSLFSEQQLFVFLLQRKNTVPIRIFLLFHADSLSKELKSDILFFALMLHICNIFKHLDSDIN